MALVTNTALRLNIARDQAPLRLRLRLNDAQDAFRVFHVQLPRDPLEGALTWHLEGFWAETRARFRIES